MASIIELIKNIRKARLGKDVRESIASAIEQTYEDATEKGSSNMEVAQARGIFDTLNQRLNNSDSLKADRTEVQKAESNLQTQINSLGSGRPAGVYATVEALTTADPDHSRIYVVSSDGHWYYYANNQWNDGGQYQATGIENYSITKIKINNDLFINDEIAFRNININSKNRNQFSKYLTLNAQNQLLINLKGILKTDLETSNNIFRVQIRGTNSLQNAGDTLESIQFPINPNGNTNIEINSAYDLSNYLYCNIVFTVLVDNYNVINKNIIFENEKFIINDKTPNLVETFSPTTDVAIYDFSYLITNTKTAITKSEVEEMINKRKINEIQVETPQELVNAINSIATDIDNNKANKENIYNIYLSAGTYEVYPYIDKTNLQDQKLYKRGLEIPDYVNLIGVGDVIISCTIPDEDNTSSENRSRIISTINTYGENYFKNIQFVANNCRYCVHDDGGGKYKNRNIAFEDCIFTHNGIITANNWPNPYCYGGGYTGGRKGLFKRCIFNNIFIPFYVHTSSSFYMTNKCYVDIDNCVFNTKNNYSIDLQEAYGTSYVGNVSINNSILNSSLLLRGSNKWNVFGGGNSKFTIDNKNDSNVYIIQ